MNTRGYQKQRFPNLQGQIFDCLICNGIVKAPKQCSGCGNLYCSTCIDQYKKNHSNCPNNCSSAINIMTSKALLGIYNDLDIKCSKGCQKVFKLIDLKKHQDLCGRVKCFNFTQCQGFQNKKYNKIKNIVCSQRCAILQQLLQFFFLIRQTGGDVKQMYKIISNSSPQLPLKANISSKQLSNLQLPLSEQLKWDQKKCGTGVQFQNNGTLAFLKQQAYVFRTVLGSKGFTGGVHYWQIIADSRTQNQLKIGVSGSNVFDFNTAFCDHVFGFAFYGLGQLRQGSNASGPQFGKRFKKQGILGVCLNMDKGTLSFSLNGEYFGVAFTDPNLKSGPLYPAVSLLHCAGCTIKGQLPVPSYFK